ncbi:NAD-dependent epimerase/dehydratase family protein [Zavarzinia sp. CC-PAN008]|uniref:NAD-dependent epimerase/dehydratase family protein n=1 Tax=Zavarzinia sp. CC-PAN008 TaxID=3243332 RepID=UPI003F744D97
MKRPINSVAGWDLGAIVTGASGFIGTYLIDTLVRQGDFPIVAIDILPPRRRHPQVQYVTADVRQPLDQVDLGGADGASFVCYNFAAVHTTPGHPTHEYYDTNISGALSVVALCSRLGVPHIVFTSSMSTYGPNEQPRTERDAPEPVSAYGKSKYQAEGIHRLWAAADPSRKVTIVRPAVVFGPGEGGNFTRLARALSRRIFAYPGRRDTVKSCIYVGEVVRSMGFAIQRPEPVYLYNMAYPKAYTIEDIVKAFGEAAQLPGAIGTLPYGLMRGASVPFEYLAKAGIKTGIHRERIDKLVRSTNIVPERLLTDGYAFETDLVEAIRRWRRESPDGTLT